MLFTYLTLIYFSPTFNTKSLHFATTLNFYFDDYTPASTPNFIADEPNPLPGTMKFNNTTVQPKWAIPSVTSPKSLPAIFMML